MTVKLLREGTRTVGKCDLPAVAFATGGLGGFMSGDITGHYGTGKGQGLKRRAGGAGVDLEAQAVARAEGWLGGLDVLDDTREAVKAARQLIADQVLADGDNGLRVLRLAGGRRWDGTSKAFVGFNSGGAAARAARRLYSLRCRMPSRTSVDEAASAATLAMVQSVRRWDKVTPERWAQPRFVVWLFLVGWRAAFRSFDDTERRGLRGDLAQHVGANACDVDSPAGGAGVDQASMDAWLRGADTAGGWLRPAGWVTFDGELARRRFGSWLAGSLDARPMDCERAAKRRIVSWLWQVFQVRKLTGRAGQAARARASLLVRLAYGRGWASAAKGAGFASGRAAVESLRSGGVWALLEREASKGGAESIASARAELRKRGLAAGEAVKQHRRASVGNVAVNLRVQGAAAGLLAVRWAAVESAERDKLSAAWRMYRLRHNGEKWALRPTWARAQAAWVTTYSAWQTAVRDYERAAAVAKRAAARRAQVQGGRRLAAAARLASSVAQDQQRRLAFLRRRRVSAVQAAVAARDKLRTVRIDAVDAWRDGSKGLRSGWLRA